jgi:hypothetical protein
VIQTLPQRREERKEELMKNCLAVLEDEVGWLTGAEEGL